MCKSLCVPIALAIAGCGGNPVEPLAERSALKSTAALESGPVCEFPDVAPGVPQSNVCDVGGTTPLNGNTVEGCFVVNGALVCPIQNFDANGAPSTSRTNAC